MAKLSNLYAIGRGRGGSPELIGPFMTDEALASVFEEAPMTHELSPDQLTAATHQRRTMKNFQEAIDAAGEDDWTVTTDSGKTLTIREWLDGWIDWWTLDVDGYAAYLQKPKGKNDE